MTPQKKYPIKYQEPCELLICAILGVVTLPSHKEEHPKKLAKPKAKKKEKKNRTNM